MRKLALVQVNNAYGENVYLPLSVGCLWAYARRQDWERGVWDEPTFLYKKEPIDRALSRLGDPLPELVCFSVYIWNAEWSYALARAVKELSPLTTVVYGGVHVPDHPAPEWWDNHPECNYLIHGEGEHAFAGFLREYANGRAYEKVPCLSHRDFRTERKFGPLEELVSPYLDGVFDPLLPLERRWQVLQETNRGCPYACTFCEWGAAALNKVRQFPMERVLGEVEWFAGRGVDYVDNADANFGILQRDEEIAEAFVRAKERWGAPGKFRTSFAKYTNKNIAERVYRIAKMLHGSGQLKAVTLALQSTDEHVREEIKRKNINMAGFAEWQNRYRGEGIPTYTELILGLPGETYDTFKRGLDAVLDSGQHEGLFMYMLTALPNTPFVDPDYVKRHGVKAVRMQAMLSHGTPAPGAPVEYQDTVVETSAMPFWDWKKAYLLAWAVQALHSFGLTRWWAERERAGGLAYSRFYEGLIEFIDMNPSTALGRAYTHTKRLMEGAVSGGSWDNVLPVFGDISWPPDEGGFLQIMTERERFYDEMEFWGMPPEQREHGPAPIPAGREEEYAREIVWYGRKGNKNRKLPSAS